MLPACFVCAVLRERISALLEKRLEKQQQRFKRLMMENEELRQTLIAEMDRADENLQDLEKQSRRTPSAGLGMSWMRELDHQGSVVAKQPPYSDNRVRD